jgi:hypothetical protein
MLTTKPNSEQIIRTEGSIAVVREHDKHGHNTGATYYHCLHCSAEVMTSLSKAALPHADDCPNAEMEADR